MLEPCAAAQLHGMAGRGAAPPALAALQPEMKFHFPLSSSRQFWFHCNNGADAVPVPLWDKLAGSAPPNFHSPGPELPPGSRAGMFLLGWHCQGPCPCLGRLCLLQGSILSTLLALEMFSSFWHKPSRISCLFQACLTCGSSSEVSESLSCLCVGGWSCCCCVVNKLPLDL